MQGRHAASTRDSAVSARVVPGHGADSMRVQWPVLLLVVLLLVGLGVLVSAAGPAQFGDPRVAGVPGFDSPLPAPDGGSRAGVPDPNSPATAALPGWTTVVWMLGVCMLVALVVRSAMRLLRAGNEQEDGRREPGSPEAAEEAELGPLLRAGVRSAAQVLDASANRGDERNGVILCWLALEDAASRSGVRRRTTQTPTEFTSALLDASRADPAATRELLALYHRARFGTRPLLPDCVDRARAALELIGETLAEATADASSRLPETPSGRTGA